MIEVPTRLGHVRLGQDPEAADNRWFERRENGIPIIYFLGIAPSHYLAILPAFICGWDAKALRASVAFGMPDQEAMLPPENALERDTPYGRSNSAASGSIP